MSSSSRFALIGLLIYSITIEARQEIRFERIGVDDGLSQSAVSAIIQDKYGYLWIGTLDGLNRYDGNDIKVYRNKPGSLSSIPINQITGLYLDQNQNLWLTSNGFLCLYQEQTDSFKSFPVKLDGDKNNGDIIHNVMMVHDSLFYLNTNAGILEFNPESGLVSYSKDFQRFQGEDVFVLTQSKGMGTWITTDNKLFHLKDSGEWEVIFEDPNRLVALVDDSSVYIHTREKLLRYSNGKLHTIDTYSLLEEFDYSNFSLTKLQNGELWVARRLIYVYDVHGVRQQTLVHKPESLHSLSGNYIICVYQSRDGVVWVGTGGFGLNKYNPALSVFNNISSSTGNGSSLSHDFVYAIYTKNENELYVGNAKGFDVLNLENGTRKNYKLFGLDGQPAYVNRIFETGDGAIWLCTIKGLKKLTLGVISNSGNQILDSTSLSVFDFQKISDDNYFFATSNGIYQWRPSNNEATRVAPWGSMVIGYYQEKLWTETAKDIRVTNPGSAKLLHVFPKQGGNSNEFISTQVKCFYEDSDGNFWIGTWGGGLSLYLPDEQKFIHYNEEAGLPNNVVYGILEDDEKRLWVSTNKGISVFDKKLKRVVRNYTKDDGLQSNEFNTRAYFKSKSGRFYFGGINGVTLFKPEEALKLKAEVPRAIVTGFLINQSPVNQLRDGSSIDFYNLRDLNLSWDERNFGVEVAGLGFGSPGRTNFRYLLQNFDGDWNYIGNQRRITFTNIPPGKYMLKIQASNSFGDWEEEGLLIDIVVRGPIWKSTWFIAACFIGLIVIGLIFYWARIRTLRYRAIYLGRLVNERTREIQVKNEEIAAQNEELFAQSEVLSNQNIELAAVKATLEEKVEERTRTLLELNRELTSRNSQLEQFTFITAHNIRGPVARIKGLLNILPNRGNQNELKHLEDSVQNLDEVISDLSLVLNIRHSNERIFEPVNLLTQLELAIQTLEIDIKHASARMDISQFQAIQISGVKAYVYSILFNLLQNALKYRSLNQKLIINCTCAVAADKVVVTIQDNGLGIDMKYAGEKIFHLYQRFHPSVKGKGFGLFLVKTQVEAMDGKIQVESELHKGTTFTVEFPIPGNRLL